MLDQLTDLSVLSLHDRTLFVGLFLSFFLCFFLCFFVSLFVLAWRRIDVEKKT